MKLIVTLAIVGITCSAWSRAEIVYDNLAEKSRVDSPGYFLAPLHGEAANAVELGGNARQLESITVAYSGFDFVGGETITLSLYALDHVINGFLPFPGSLIFSATVPITEASDGRITVTDPSGTWLPNDLAVAFSFPGANRIHSGLLPYIHPVVGDQSGGLFFREPQYPAWAPVHIHGIGQPWNGFGVIITAVPEAGNWIDACGLFTLVGLGLTHRRVARS